MATFKDLKNKLTGNTPTPTPTQDQTDLTLEIEESRYLLALIAKSDFSGKDVQIVYNIALKLQKQIQNFLDKE